MFYFKRLVVWYTDNPAVLPGFKEQKQDFNIKEPSWKRPEMVGEVVVEALDTGMLKGMLMGDMMGIEQYM